MDESLRTPYRGEFDLVRHPNSRRPRETCWWPPSAGLKDGVVSDQGSEQSITVLRGELI